MYTALQSVHRAHMRFLELFEGLLWASSTFNINIARGIMLGDGFRKLVVRVVGPNSYTTGGEAITAGQFRLGVIEFIDGGMMINVAGTLAVFAAWNDVSNKLQYFWYDATAATAHAFAEVTNATDLSGFSGRILVYGK